MLSIVRNATTSGIAPSARWHSLEKPKTDKMQDEPPTDEQLLCESLSSL